MNKLDAQEASCFMCTKAGPRGCLECRFQSMARDIRTALYEKMGAEQHAAEWEDRGLVLESNIENLRAKLFQERQSRDQFRSALEYNSTAVCVARAAIERRDAHDEMRKCIGIGAPDYDAKSDRIHKAEKAFLLSVEAYGKLI